MKFTSVFHFTNPLLQLLISQQNCRDCTYIHGFVKVLYLKHYRKGMRAASMDRILLSLQKRFLIPIVVALGLLVWLIWCNAHYRSYWHGTIYRVQTTDFNLLHHSLPQTLSMMIIQGRTDLVQKTL